MHEFFTKIKLNQFYSVKRQKYSVLNSEYFPSQRQSKKIYLKINVYYEYQWLKQNNLLNAVESLKIFRKHYVIVID